MGLGSWQKIEDDYDVTKTKQLQQDSDFKIGII